MFTLADVTRIAALTFLTVGSAVEPTIVNAATVAFVSPDSASASNSDLIGAPSTNLINRSGIAVNTITLENIESTIHSYDGVSATGWRGSAFAMPITIVFGFDTPQQVGYLGLWQWVENEQGVGNFSVSFWDGPAGTGNPIGSEFLGTLDIGSGGIIPQNGRAFDVGARAAVHSVSMKILSVAVPINTYVHFGEFMIAPSIPEPSVNWLFVAAMPLLLFVARRRRHTEAFTANL